MYIRLCISALIALCSFALPVLAQESAPPAAAATKPATPPTLAMVFDQQVKNVEGEFVSAAEAMPEDKYNYAPTSGKFDGVRNFGEQVKHVAAANYIIWGAAIGEKPPMDLNEGAGPASMKSKAEILQFLKDSFALGHKAANAITMQNELEMISSPFGKMTRLTLTSMPVAHAFDHYGQMVEYLRMNSIIPPASRRQ